MLSEHRGSEPALSFAIEYQAGRDYNRDLGGRGALIVRQQPAAYVFRGRARRLVSHGLETERVFAPEEMRNVAFGGRRVQFTTTAGRSGAKERPFVFFAASDEEAREIAGLLPATRDPEFVAGLEFQEKLRRLPAAGRWWSSTTNLIVAANAAVFVAMGLAGAGWFETASIKPYILYGANNGAITTDGEWWRLVSCLFIHFGLLHLALNMWALYQAGHLVERLFGRARYTVLYFGSGVIGSLATLWWHGDKVWSAGASGAVFGVYGALLGYFVREKHGVPRSVFQPIMKSTLTFAGYNLLYGTIHPHIDNAAHIGGVLGGLVLGWLMAAPVDLAARARLARRRLAAGLVVLVLAIAAGVRLAPRFPYNAQDELRWSEVNEAPLAKEPAIIKDEQRAFQALETRRDVAGLIAWLRDEAIPFYDGWHQQVVAVPLKPQRSTARRRDVLARILALKTESYRQLLADLQAGNPEALTAFRRAEDEIARELKEMSEEK